MEINEYLISIIRVIKEMEDLALFSEAAKLSRTEFRLLQEVIIEREKGKQIISSELARRLGVTRSAVSQIVTKLEKSNIICRKASSTDRKIAYICLSDRSIAVFEEQCRQANEIVARVVEEFGKDRMDALINSYDEFAAILTRVRKEAEERGRSEREDGAK